jgi:hypothetical protein
LEKEDREGRLDQMEQRVQLDHLDLLGHQEAQAWMEEEVNLATRDTKGGQVFPDCLDWVACLVSLEMLDLQDLQVVVETGVNQEEEVLQVPRVQMETQVFQAHRVHLGHLAMTVDRVLLDLQAHLVHLDHHTAEVLLLKRTIGSNRPIPGLRDPIHCMVMIRMWMPQSPTLTLYRSEKQLTVSKYLLVPRNPLHAPARNWHNHDQI